MNAARDSDGMTFWLLMLLAAPLILATLVTSCDARDRARATTAAIEARTTVALMSAKAADPVQEQLVRQRLALELVERRDAQTRATVEEYKWLIMYALAAVGGLVTLVGVILPVLQHFTTTVPARELVTEARQVVDNIDERFAEWTARQEQQFIEKCIEQLGSPEPYVRQQAAANLALRQHVRLSNAQVVAMGEAGRASNELTSSATLFMLIASYDIPYVSRLMLDLIRSGEAMRQLPYVLKHCAVPTSSSVRQAVRDWAVATPGALSSLVIHSMFHAVSFFREFINDAEWLANFDTASIRQALATAEASASTYGVTEAVKDSELYRLAKGKGAA